MAKYISRFWLYPPCRCIYDTDQRLVKHLCNPMNENKPVHIARDGQEVPAHVGDELVQIMETTARQAGVAVPPAVGAGQFVCARACVCVCVRVCV